MGNYRHGKRYSRIYNIWRSMRQRCKNPNSVNYKNYGEKGIAVCDEWNDFENFYNWAMENGYQEELTIDRIDVNGNYTPSNCRWISYKQQANNKTNNRLIEFQGEIHTLGEWASITKIKLPTIWARLKYGWSVEKALTIPPKKKTGRTV